MMKTTIAPDLLADPKVSRIVQSANDVLLKQVGTASDPPEAMWKRAGANGNGDYVELDLRYDDDDLATRFTTQELEDTSELRYRLLRAWRKLAMQVYQRSSDRTVKILREWRKDLEENPED